MAVAQQFPRRQPAVEGPVWLTATGLPDEVGFLLNFGHGGFGSAAGGHGMSFDRHTLTDFRKWGSAQLGDRYAYLVFAS
jgi:hypothetical protein